MTDTSRIGLINKGLIDIAKTAAGVTAGFYPPPPQLDTVSLPAVFAFTGSGSYKLDETEIFQVTRIFRVQVACLPTGQGNPKDREEQIPPLIVNVAHALNAKQYTHHLDFVEEIRVVNDSGLVILPEWGAKFIGFELQVEVKYFERRT